MDFLVLLGRVLFAGIFVISSFGHLSGQGAEYAAKAGLPLAHIAVPLAGVLLLLGGLSILLGFRARIGAWLLVIFLIPATLMFHNFWAYRDPAMAQMQQANFMKNISMLGAALLIAYFGAGPWSIDSLLSRSKTRT